MKELVKEKEGRETVTCPTCYGSGKRGNGVCGLCKGKGTIRVMK